LEKKLQNQFHELEKQRSELLQKLGSLSPEVLNKTSVDSKWSPNQIILHLILAEQLSYKSIKAKLIKGNLEKAGIMSSVRAILLRLFLRSNIKFKAPVAVSLLPSNLDFNTLLEDWSKSRLQFEEMLESLPDHLLTKYIFKHPAAGKMNIYGCLTFMKEHIRRHEQQVVKIISES
jgi:DinB superfamily